MALTPGTQVILQAFTEAQCPACNYNPAIHPALVGKRYVVIQTTPVTMNGVTYQVVDLSPKYIGDPGISWPEFALKLALS